MILRTLALAAACALAGPALAATPEGVWLTPPDGKGQTAHITAQRCGAAWCGTITAAFDAGGRQITTPNVGKRVFWDMVPGGAGFAGRAWVPAHGRSYQAEMRPAGRSMVVRGCLGPVCQSQTWRKVR
ncbi:MAG: DUF2147 domain-containing protein [Pseudomonadota bacterium]